MQIYTTASLQYKKTRCALHTLFLYITPVYSNYSPCASADNSGKYFCGGRGAVKVSADCRTDTA